MQGAVFVSLHCFSQITDLKNDLEQTRLLAALGLLEAQNKGTFPAIPISIDRTNDTVYIPRFDLMVLRCNPGKSGEFCENGTASTYQYCSVTTPVTAVRIREHWTVGEQAKSTTIARTLFMEGNPIGGSGLRTRP